MAEDTTSDAIPQAPPESNKRTTALMVGAGLLLGAVGGLTFVRPREALTRLASADSASRNADSAAHSSPRPVHMIENLVVNPAQTGGTRFLMLAIAVEVKNADVENTLKARDSEVRDAVLRVLSTRTVQDLTDLTRRDSLRDQIRAAIATKLAPGQIGQLYFPQFVIQ